MDFRVPYSLDGLHQSPSYPHLSILARLESLDLKLNRIEEKRSLLERESCSEEVLNGRCRPLASVLQEVCYQGTLMDRLQMLENRILMLSYEMENDGLFPSQEVPNYQLAPNYGLGDEKKDLVFSQWLNKRREKEGEEELPICSHEQFDGNEPTPQEKSVKEVINGKGAESGRKGRNEKKRRHHYGKWPHYRRLDEC
ncbi:uncharacterized protein LOC110007752 isoform X2 [Amborella trichopoda]|uniref:uncharacterized protein LOC110007752 isoform X2 n=1 Tax=Amborella trichopoda TaxID=13333 RepID=UPI0009C044D0|nr:uncharacterized protein LOC110007752 isoform X2 [Amborella trichopoda]|eukprot:XP_020526343.1 uncharacterized protein LOC110007752 isoform X2 [Amborella trichopoda]